MAYPKEKYGPPKTAAEPKVAGAPKALAPGFDVTCVVGRVTLGDGEESSHVAAFKLIAKHDAPGVYTFPLGPGSGICRVTVAYED